MTVQKIFYEYLLLASDDTIEKRERTAKKCVELTEDYHKESSKELVEALNRIVDVKNNIRHYEDFDPNLMEAIDQAERALENHLK